MGRLASCKIFVSPIRQQKTRMKVVDELYESCMNSTCARVQNSILSEKTLRCEYEVTSEGFHEIFFESAFLTPKNTRFYGRFSGVICEVILSVWFRAQKNRQARWSLNLTVFCECCLLIEFVFDDIM